MSASAAFTSPSTSETPFLASALKAALIERRTLGVNAPAMYPIPAKRMSLIILLLLDLLATAEVQRKLSHFSGMFVIRTCGHMFVFFGQWLAIFACKSMMAGLLVKAAVTKMKNRPIM